MLTPDEQFMLYRKMLALQQAARVRFTMVQRGQMEKRRATKLAHAEQKEFKELLKEVG